MVYFTEIVGNIDGVCDVCGKIRRSCRVARNGHKICGDCWGEL